MNRPAQPKCAVLLPKPDAMPADLALVVEAWDTLPGPIKAAILAMVESAKGQ